jgi:hypothetical protein
VTSFRATADRREHIRAEDEWSFQLVHDLRERT